MIATHGLSGVDGVIALETVVEVFQEEIENVCLVYVEVHQCSTEHVI